jgi:hypothetical protein
MTLTLFNSSHSVQKRTCARQRGPRQSTTSETEMRRTTAFFTRKERQFMLGKTLGCVAVLLLSTSICFSDQTIFLDHASTVCTASGGITLKGTWFNTTGCRQATSYFVGTLGVCTSNETASGPVDCHFFFCCCYKTYTDKDSRTINDNCDLSTISTQVTITNVCD